MIYKLVSTHSRLKAAGVLDNFNADAWAVSTHSRLKAAGFSDTGHKPGLPRFNTQPPEGGWNFIFGFPSLSHCFNTQPPEGGWLILPFQQV